MGAAMAEGLQRAFSAAARSAGTIADHEILHALAVYPGATTPAVRDMLSHHCPGIKTATVLARLKRLEREGKVERAETSFAVMIAWRRKL